MSLTRVSVPVCTYFLEIQERAGSSFYLSLCVPHKLAALILCYYALGMDKRQESKAHNSQAAIYLLAVQTLM